MKIPPAKLHHQINNSGNNSRPTNDYKGIPRNEINANNHYNSTLKQSRSILKKELGISQNDEISVISNELRGHVDCNSKTITTDIMGMLSERDNDQFFEIAEEFIRCEDYKYASCLAIIMAKKSQLRDARVITNALILKNYEHFIMEMVDTLASENENDEIYGLAKTLIDHDKNILASKIAIVLAEQDQYKYAKNIAGELVTKEKPHNIMEIVEILAKKGAKDEIFDLVKELIKDVNYFLVKEITEKLIDLGLNNGSGKTIVKDIFQELLNNKVIREKHMLDLALMLIENDVAHIAYQYATNLSKKFAYESNNNYESAKLIAIKLFKFEYYTYSNDIMKLLGLYAPAEIVRELYEALEEDIDNIQTNQNSCMTYCNIS